MSKRILTLCISIFGIFSPLSAIASDQDTQWDQRPGVRYTTGTYKVSGWEKQLVGGDPNLKRWNWSPIVGYTQTTKPSPTRKQALTAPLPQRKSICIKPIHVPLPTVHYSEARPAVEAKRIDASATASKTSVVLSYSAPYQDRYQGRDNLIAHTNLNGVLMHRDVSAMLKGSSEQRNF